MASDRPYTKRELDLLFKGAEEKNDAWSATLLQKLQDLDEHRITPILEQTKKTNGRVSKLERNVIILGVFVAALYLSRPELAKQVISIFL